MIRRRDYYHATFAEWMSFYLTCWRTNWSRRRRARAAHKTAGGAIGTGIK